MESQLEVHLLQKFDLLQRFEICENVQVAEVGDALMLYTVSSSEKFRNSWPGLHDEGPEQTARPLFPANFFIFGETVFLQFFICALFLFSLLLPF